MKNIALCLRYDGSRYHGGEGRTRLKVLRYTQIDLMAFLAGAALLAGVIVLRHFGL